MRLVRIIVMIAATLLLAGGYVSSQMAFVASRFPQSRDAAQVYAANIDSIAVKGLALLILVACVVMAIVTLPAEGAD